MDLQRPEPEDFLCDESFLRFCQGDRSATLFWENWMRSHEEYAVVVEKALRLYDVLNAGQGNREEQLAALKDALVRRKRFEQMVSEAKVVKMKRKPWLRYTAAAVLILSTGSLGYWFFWAKQPVETPSLFSYEYTTAAGTHKTVVLPDSSVIMLNANSHLSIARNFNSEHREVTITGEAFFDVKHDEEHPFIVHTSEYRIRVLGTAFNVKSCPGGAGSETDLVSGKVEIVTNDGMHPKDRIILRPNEKFVLERKPAISKISGTAPAAPVKGVVTKLQLDTLSRHAVETAWARRKMEINDETLGAIAARLEAWYGIKVIFKDEDVKKYRYTAAFNDETIFKALQYLQQSYPFSYRIENDAIVISRS